MHPNNVLGPGIARFLRPCEQPRLPRQKSGRLLSRYLQKALLSEKRTGPTAEQPPPFYKYVCSTLQSIRTALPDVDLVNTPATEVCECLAIQRLTHEELQRCKNVNWRNLTSSAVPAEVRDFGWRRGWRVLPTRTRTAAWGITNNNRCPQCRQTETLRHALFDCPVSKTFWFLLWRMFHVRIQRTTQPRILFHVVLWCIGAFVLWRQRGSAALQGQPNRAMYPLLRRLRKLMYEQACVDLFNLSEDQFLRKWSTRFINLRNGRITAQLLAY